MYSDRQGEKEAWRSNAYNEIFNNQLVENHLESRPDLEKAYKKKKAAKKTIKKFQNRVPYNTPEVLANLQLPGILNVQESKAHMKLLLKLRNAERRKMDPPKGPVRISTIIKENYNNARTQKLALAAKIDMIEDRKLARYARALETYNEHKKNKHGH